MADKKTNMRKVIVIGSPGAGKSTFARQLAQMTGFQLYHLDMIWHKPDGTTIATDEFDLKLSDILKQDYWIIDGNYQRTLEKRIIACDTIILLDFPLELCLSGAQQRIGKKRADLPWVESCLDPEFRQLIIDFPRTKLPRIYQLLEIYKQTKNVLIFKSRSQASNYLSEISLKELG